MCDLCYQLVSLTGKNIRESYFKHSRGEEEKNCPERSFGNSQWNEKNMTLQLETRGMPIRISVSKSGYYFELGFPVLKEVSVNQDAVIEIQTNKQSFRYNAERIDSNEMTFLNVGSYPSEKYIIKVTNQNDRLRRFWPAEVDGVTDNKLFKKSNGLMVKSGSDISAEEEYYLFTRKIISNSSPYMNVKRVCSSNGYYVYLIKPESLNSEVAKYFLEEYHCRLTAEPIQMTFLWPIIIKKQFITYHFSDILYVNISGDASFKLFPEGFLEHTPLRSGQLLKLKLNDRQQMLSIGRNINIIDYSYFWKSDLAESPDYVVSEVVQVNSNKLCITPNYDGHVDVLQNGWIIKRLAIEAGKYFEIDYHKQQFDYRVYEGKDCIWKNTKEVKQSEKSYKDRELLELMQKCRGAEIVPPQRIRLLITRMESFPLTKSWISKQIRKGLIKKEAITILLNYFDGSQGG